MRRKNKEEERERKNNGVLMPLRAFIVLIGSHIYTCTEEERQYNILILYLPLVKVQTHTHSHTLNALWPHMVRALVKSCTGFRAYPIPISSAPSESIVRVCVCVWQNLWLICASSSLSVIRIHFNLLYLLFLSLSIVICINYKLVMNIQWASNDIRICIIS